MKILACLLLVLFANFAHAIVIHVAPIGSDRNDGRTAEKPVATLGRAQSIMEALPPQDFVVTFAPGTYIGQSVSWRYTMPDHTIRFLGAKGHRSLFDGHQKGLTFFRLRSAKGEATNLVFDGLQVARYVTAISLEGNKENFRLFNARNTIVNNHFIDVGGTGFSPMGYSTAVVRIINSDSNVISDNTFKGMVGVRCQHLHALYLAHGASHNLIERNLFENGCGDPVRLRDASNDNIVRNNQIVKAGDKAAVSEWFCTGSKCAKEGAECPPLRNLVSGNIVKGDHAGAAMPEHVVHKRPVSPRCQQQ